MELRDDDEGEKKFSPDGNVLPVVENSDKTIEEFIAAKSVARRKSWARRNCMQKSHYDADRRNHFGVDSRFVADQKRTKAMYRAVESTGGCGFYGKWFIRLS